jgi:hypothetical protein
MTEQLSLEELEAAGIAAIYGTYGQNDRERAGRIVRAVLDAVVPLVGDGKCQFSDKTHLTHTPFSERAPICFACFNAALDATDDEWEQVGSGRPGSPPEGIHSGWYLSDTMHADPLGRWQPVFCRLLSPVGEEETG